MVLSDSCSNYGTVRYHRFDFDHPARAKSRCRPIFQPYIHMYMYSNTYISITCTYNNAVCVISSSLVVAGTGRGCLCASGAAMLDLGLAVMRGERERPRVHMAYWLLAAVYAFAMLGNAVAAGEGMLQDVALCIPLVTAAVPLGVGVAAGAATEAATCGRGRAAQPTAYLLVGMPSRRSRRHRLRRRPVPAHPHSYAPPLASARLPRCPIVRAVVVQVARENSTSAPVE